MSAASDPFAERLQWFDAVRRARQTRQSTAKPMTRLQDATRRQLKAEVRAMKRRPKP